MPMLGGIVSILAICELALGFTASVALANYLSGEKDHLVQLGCCAAFLPTILRTHIVLRGVDPGKITLLILLISCTVLYLLGGIVLFINEVDRDRSFPWVVRAVCAIGAGGCFIADIVYSIVKGLLLKWIGKRVVQAMSAELN